MDEISRFDGIINTIHLLYRCKVLEGFSPVWGAPEQRRQQVDVPDKDLNLWLKNILFEIAICHDLKAIQ